MPTATRWAIAEEPCSDLAGAGRRLESLQLGDVVVINSNSPTLGSDSGRCGAWYHWYVLYCHWAISHCALNSLSAESPGGLVLILELQGA